MTAPHFKPLTCEIALERLDAAWLNPLPEETVDADLFAAREHLQDCSACWLKFEERRAADQRIETVMQAVPIPVGLREQLLAQTMADTASGCVSDTKHIRSDLHRRAWWISVAAMLLVSVAGSSWLWQRTHPQRVSMQALCDQTPLISTGLDKMEGSAQFPKLPATWLTTRGLKIVEVPCFFSPANASGAFVWIAFEYRSTAKQPVAGVLLVTRQIDVADPPPPLLVRPTWFRYTQRDGKPVSVAGWSEHGAVYLCFVPGEPASLEKVLRATAPTSA